MDGVYMANNHDHDCFQKQAICVDDRMPSASFRWQCRHRYTIDEFDSRDKQRVLRYHRNASCLCSVTTTMIGASPCWGKPSAWLPIYDQASLSYLRVPPEVPEK